MKVAQYSVAVVLVSSLLVGGSAVYAHTVQRHEGPAPARVEPQPGDRVVEGLAVAFPAGKIVLQVGDKEQEFPVAASVQVTERGAPSQWSVLHANSTLRLRIRDGKVVAVDIR